MTSCSWGRPSIIRTTTSAGPPAARIARLEAGPASPGGTDDPAERARKALDDLKSITDGGRTIAVEHSETGHVYEYVWFREAPHLRLPLVRENEMATVPVAELMANAKKAAMLELENASLLNVAD